MMEPPIDVATEMTTPSIVNMLAVRARFQNTIARMNATRYTSSDGSR